MTTKGDRRTMTPAEAKRDVCRVLAITLRNDLDNGAGWLEEHPVTREPMSEVDAEILRAAAAEVVVELERFARGRGGDLTAAAHTRVYELGGGASIRSMTRRSGR